MFHSCFENFVFIVSERVRVNTDNSRAMSALSPGQTARDSRFSPNYRQLLPTIIQMVKRPKKFVTVDDSSPAVAQAKSREQRVPSVKMRILNASRKTNL